MKEPTNEVDIHAVVVVHINSRSKEVVVGHVPKLFPDCVHVVIITRVYPKH